MPFIDCRTTQQLTEAQKEAVKAKLGRAIAVLHKPESYLMVGFADETLYFAGKKLEKGAYVSVSLFGAAASKDYERMTGEICDILASEAGIPADKVYVTYHPVADWGWNGANF